MISNDNHRCYYCSSNSSPGLAPYRRLILQHRMSITVIGKDSSPSISVPVVYLHLNAPAGKHRHRKRKKGKGNCSLKFKENRVLLKKKTGSWTADTLYEYVDLLSTPNSVQSRWLFFNCQKKNCLRRRPVLLNKNSVFMFVSYFSLNGAVVKKTIMFN